METETSKKPEWPPRITFAWRGVLLRIAAYYEQGKPEGKELLELLATYLEQSPATPEDFIEWSDTEAIIEKLRQFDGPDGPPKA